MAPISKTSFLQATLVGVVLLQALFLWDVIPGLWTPDVMAQILASMLPVRGAIMLVELFGIAVLFVDVVTRFDELNPKWKVLHCITVAACMIGYILQFFVYFLDSAYLE